MEKDPAKADQLAQVIEQVNSARQAELEKIIVEAREIVKKNQLDKKKVILISGHNWAPGLVGLVAGKLMEEFARPTVVLEKGDKISRGSARSIEMYQLLDAFTYAAKYLKTFGGHARAGGLSLENQHFDALYELLLEYAEEKLSDTDLIPKIKIDAQLNDEDLSLDLIDSIEKLEPFGFGNPKPLFVLRSQKVKKN
jgi:single-stranded-DNA-specific exonuclease